jgi:hypothetical protein
MNSFENRVHNVFTSSTAGQWSRDAEGTSETAPGPVSATSPVFHDVNRNHFASYLLMTA